MAEQTTYYHMMKPSEEEKYNINVFNANMDVIDSALNRMASKLENIGESVDIASDDDIDSLFAD